MVEIKADTVVQEHVWRALHYEIEGVILRRLHAGRIQGYTLEMAQELTALYFSFRPDKVLVNQQTGKD